MALVTWLLTQDEYQNNKQLFTEFLLRTNLLPAKAPAPGKRKNAPR